MRSGLHGRSWGYDRGRDRHGFALRAFALFGRAGIFSETGMCFEESKADRMHTGTVSTSDLGGSGEGPLNSRQQQVMRLQRQARSGSCKQAVDHGLRSQFLSKCDESPSYNQGSGVLSLRF